MAAARAGSDPLLVGVRKPQGPSRAAGLETRGGAGGLLLRGDGEGGARCDAFGQVAPPPAWCSVSVQGSADTPRGWDIRAALALGTARGIASSFLSDILGEETVRFFLKMCLVALVAAAVYFEGLLTAEK